MIIDDAVDSRIKGTLSELGADDDERRARYLADKAGLPYVDLRIKSPELAALHKINRADAEKYNVAPFKIAEDYLYVAIYNPTDAETLDFIKKLKEEHKIIINIASIESIRKVLARYRDIEGENVVAKGLIDLDADSLNSNISDINTIADLQKKIEYIALNEKKERISKIIELTFAGAMRFGVSDIHTEPEEKMVRIRYRIDGALNDIYYTDKATYSLMVSRLKLLSGLKLSITSNAQDGRFSIKSSDGNIEMRVSVVPGAYGESFVMRLLDPRNANVNLEDLGMSEVVHGALEKALSKPFGMVLTTGPTGSGKTTTLYSCLKKLYTPEVKIITIEDPVEYHMSGITQTQVEVKKGYTFLSGLRAVLRQDPDAIMVGEIRDEDTAQVAAQAALTGHIVLSTLHTNTAAGAIPRFINLGVDAKTLGSSLSFIMAQRLCRKLCPKCKEESVTDERQSRIITNTIGSMLAENKISPYKAENAYKIFKANQAGCSDCHGGYKGRVGIYEGITMNKKVEDAAIKNASERELAEAASDQGIPTMREDGIIKILSGITSYEEVADVVDLTF